jgi:hypothetical protein
MHVRAAAAGRGGAPRRIAHAGARFVQDVAGDAAPAVAAPLPVVVGRRAGGAPAAVLLLTARVGDGAAPRKAGAGGGVGARVARPGVAGVRAGLGAAITRAVFASVGGVGRWPFVVRVGERRVAWRRVPGRERVDGGVVRGAGVVSAAAAARDERRDRKKEERGERPDAARSGGGRHVVQTSVAHGDSTRARIDLVCRL